MCGLAGIVNLREGPPPEREALGRMLGALRHRGPDECGMFRDAQAGLAHTRLAIIDPGSGQQPMCSPDGTLWIVFNGEIFNYLELRQELIAAGHVFRTSSDTEVIIQAWQRWGEGALPRMNGQWAFALWDTRRRRLVLARDRLGICPLHLAEQPGRLLFGSEVKAIFAADASLPRAFDPIGLGQTFTFWTAVAPRTPFRGITELEPGHVRSYEGGQVQDHAYWAPSYVPRPVSIEEATERVRRSLEQATALRMLRADVPVGSYLSGGLDSSLVAALALAATGARFHTFSLRFDDAEYDETPYQRLLAERLGTQHHEVLVGRGDIARVFPEVVRHAERPLLRTAPAPLFLLSRLVREAGIKVVLTGEGADEMFAGYDLFREGKVRRFWGRRPGSTLRPRLLERLYPYLARSPVAQRAMAREFFGKDLESWQSPGFAHHTRWRSAGALKRLFAPDLRAAVERGDVVAELLGSLPDSFAGWSPLGQDQYLEVRTLLSGYLLAAQGDRMLLANSVEGRFPFLDADVVAAANALPDEHKLKVLDEKHVLKRAARGLVPAPILARKKQPYRAPDALCFVGPAAPAWVPELLDAAAVRAVGVFDPAVVAQLWQKCRAKAEPFSNTDNMALVGVLSTQLLHGELLARPPGASAPPHVRTVVDRMSP